MESVVIAPCLLAVSSPLRGGLFVAACSVVVFVRECVGERAIRGHLLWIYIPYIGQ